ncbi:hypothetical protein, conserved [Entamoeba dispar SAW760]|uniref:Leucine rich repeat containing protein BspA family protein n=1 Tax=Entamoeba dispar (strain ATCC PRA-260 / SAW760) TaxID=370354 RepID=B0EQJ4_ENTDS|nr:uncharacterized protein EDI_230000 [Entamoeba dispar SAW760]EDR23193.1 hypothetical protein, conserved [Entamoeba dispar SAW760]|eukprot:EDR23193.1 hypothetical protein, conserved [Entamoeba dispar SAW760]
MKLGYNEIMITSMYFDDINDFINLEIGIKRFQGNMERFHFNPIPLNNYSRKLFPNIETFHIYNRRDKIFDDGRIFKKMIWYKVKYSTYYERNNKEIYKKIEYRKEDRYKYGNTIPSEVKSLGYECFERCYSLTSINIPSSVNEIGNYCFSECSSLTSIAIPSTISKIRKMCFNNCISLTNMNIINLQYTSEERIFMNKPVLVSIKIPDNLQIINGKNIEKKDVNEFIIPSSVSEIGDYCFYKCTSLKSINIPMSITKLGEECFKRCYELTTINIPSLISEIGNYCFDRCTSLTSINIPSSITTFGYGCFYKCGCEEELKKNKRIPRNCFKDNDE